MGFVRSKQGKMWALAQDALNATPRELYELSDMEIYLTAQLRSKFYEIKYDS